MKKFLNVVKAILITLLVLALGGYVVLYVCDKELAKQIMDTVIEYLNTPLPLIGIPTTVLAVLIWKIFSASAYGKKAITNIRAEYDEKARQLETEYQRLKSKYAEILSFYSREIDIVLFSVIQVCQASGNKKIREIGQYLEQNSQQFKDELRTKLLEIIDSDVSVLPQTKDEVMKEIMSMIEEKLEKKYGEKGQEIIKGIAKTN